MATPSLPDSRSQPTSSGLPPTPTAALRVHHRGQLLQCHESPLSSMRVGNRAPPSSSAGGRVKEKGCSEPHCAELALHVQCMLPSQLIAAL